MSTKAEETSIQALSPESTLGVVLTVAAWGGEIDGASSAPRKTEAVPKAENNTATHKIELAILVGPITLFPFQYQRHLHFPGNTKDNLHYLFPKPLPSQK